MPKIQRWWLLVGAGVIVFALIVLLFVHDAQTPAAPVAEPLTQTFDKSPTGFTLKYPDDWTYEIPAIGTFILAPSQTLDGTEAGPTFTVQRTEPLIELGTLDNVINRYLQNGPLHTPGNWQITKPLYTLQLDRQSTRAVELQGADVPNTPPLYTRIIAISAKNTFVYLLITTEPASKRTAYDPTLDAMLATVQILE